MNNFLGKDGFHWWVGIVESRMDPLNLGRVRVRIFGWHTENLQELPSDDLSWALPLLPANSRDYSNTPYENDWVVGFFMDGEAGQFPICLGVLPGIPSNESDKSKGFADHRTSDQLTNAPQNDYPRGLNEPTTSRLYRAENLDKTILKKIKDNKVTGVAGADGSSWSQPDPSYKTVPPYNEVIETESGHVFELDDSKGAERVNLAHRTGTFIEMRPDGSQVTRIVKDNYEIISGNDFVVVKGTCNITINGNANIQVDGNLTSKVGGNAKIDIGGQVDLTAGGNVNGTAPNFNLKGTLNVDGPINSTQNITDKTRSMSSDRAIYDSHRHTGVRGGPDTSGPPTNQQ